MADRPGEKPEIADRHLVSRAKSGEPEALVALLEEHYDMIFRTAYRWLGHRDDAEDVTQQVAMKLQAALANYDERSVFRGWLYRITINAARDLQRSHTRRARYTDALALVSADQDSPRQEDGLHAESLWKAVRALPDKQRDAVLLVYGEDLTHAQAAEVMGCKEPTVSWHVSQARKALREKL